MTLDLALDVAHEGWRAVPDLERLVSRALDQACQRSGHAVIERAEVSVLLCDDDTIRRLNKDWRGKDKPTNVLSFPSPGPIESRPLLGDIAIAWETTAGEAADEMKPVADHLTHLVVHGCLHLLGFDHDDASEAERMERLEILVLGDLGVADPYRGAELTEHEPR